LLLLLLLTRSMELLLLLSRSLHLQWLVWVVLLVLTRHRVPRVDCVALSGNLLLLIQLLLWLGLGVLLGELDMHHRARHLMILRGGRIVVLRSLLVVERLLVALVVLLLLLLRLLHLMRTGHRRCMVLLWWTLGRRLRWPRVISRPGGWRRLVGRSHNALLLGHSDRRGRLGSPVHGGEARGRRRGPRHPQPSLSGPQITIS